MKVYEGEGERVYKSDRVLLEGERARENVCKRGV